jgi:hypothetical protein
MKNRIVTAILLLLFGFAVSHAEIFASTQSGQPTVVQSCTSDDPPPIPPPPPLP